MNEMFKKVGHNVWIELDFGSIILNCGEVTIGNDTLLGPNIGIYPVNHTLDAQEGINGGCISKPANIKGQVWLSGNVKIPSGVIAAGNPCKVIRYITDSDKTNYLNEMKM